MDSFYACLILAGAVGLIVLAIWASRADMRDEQVAQKQAQQRVFAEAQDVATAADERLVMDEASRDVMAAFERVAAAAWRGESEESK